MERIERLQERPTEIHGWIGDEKLAKKIWGFLGERKDMHYDDVDALYFDYSVIPRHLQGWEKGQFSRDAYMLFGITENGEVITHWIDRWELDKAEEKQDG